MALWKLPRLFMRRKCWRASRRNCGDSLCGHCSRVKKHFEIIDRKDFGGTLLQLLLEDIVGNFSNKKPDRKILQTLFDAEQSLLKSGTLGSEFTLIVARHREQPLTG